jgi:hypothetical protein
MNLLGPELVRDLVSLIQRAEADDTVQVLVFKSAHPDYFISHVDVTRISEYRAEAAKLTGEASIALLFRYLSASPLVSIAQVEGRVRGALVDRWPSSRCRDSSISIARRLSAGWLQTAPFVAEQQWRPARLLVVQLRSAGGQNGTPGSAPLRERRYSISLGGELACADWR